MLSLTPTWRSPRARGDEHRKLSDCAFRPGGTSTLPTLLRLDAEQLHEQRLAANFRQRRWTFRRGFLSGAILAPVSRRAQTPSASSGHASGREHRPQKKPELYGTAPLTVGYSCEGLSTRRFH